MRILTDTLVVVNNRHPPLQTLLPFRKSLAVILCQCLASALHRFHVITVNAKPLVSVLWSPRVSPGILNAEDDNRQDDGGEHGGDDDGGCHCVVPLCVL